MQGQQDRKQLEHRFISQAFRFDQEVLNHFEEQSVVSIIGQVDERMDDDDKDRWRLQIWKSHAELLQEALELRSLAVGFATHFFILCILFLYFVFCILLL